MKHQLREKHKRYCSMWLTKQVGIFTLIKDSLTSYFAFITINSTIDIVCLGRKVAAKNGVKLLQL